MYNDFGVWLSGLNLNFMDVFYSNFGVTCQGALSPGSLFSNLLVIVMIILLFDSHLYPMIKLTGRSKTDMNSGNPVAKGFMFGAVVLSESVFKYAIQILLIR